MRIRIRKNLCHFARQILSQVIRISSMNLVKVISSEATTTYLRISRKKKTYKTCVCVRASETQDQVPESS